MFTIEHNFKDTVITIIDDVAEKRQDDVKVTLSEENVTIEQWEGYSNTPKTITLSLSQFKDLVHSIDLPEGAFHVKS